MIAKASRSFPKHRFQGFRDFRLLRGLKFSQDQSMDIRLVTRDQMRVGGGVQVEIAVEAWDLPAQKWFTSSSCSIWLVEEAIVVSSPTLHVADELKRPSKDAIYEDYLFHGPHFQGIVALEKLSEQGVEAEVMTAPLPEKWLRPGALPRWFADPLALDCGFQMGVIWSTESRSMRSLPMAIHSYIQYRDEFPDEFCRVKFVVYEIKDKEFEAALEFIDKDGHLIASMKGYKGVMDASLTEAFRQRHAPQQSQEQL